MAAFFLPGDSDYSVALHDPNLLIPGEKPVGAVRLKKNGTAWLFNNHLQSVDGQYRLSTTGSEFNNYPSGPAIRTTANTSVISNSDFTGSIYAIILHFYLSGADITSSSTGDKIFDFGNCDVGLGSYTSYLTGETLTVADSTSRQRTATDSTSFAQGEHTLIINWEDGYQFYLDGVELNRITNEGGVSLITATEFVFDGRKFASDPLINAYSVQLITEPVSSSLAKSISQSDAYALIESANDSPDQITVISGSVHNLTAEDAMSATSVTAPNLGQNHLLSGDNAQTATSVSSPAVAQSHQLQADAAQSGSNVSSPVMAEIHNLTSTPAQSATTVNTPIIGQVHTLLSEAAQSASSVSSPTLTENTGVHHLLAENAQSGSSVSLPVIMQVHALLSVSAESPSSVTLPIFRQDHQLLSTDVQSPTRVSSPVLTEVTGDIIDISERVTIVSSTQRATFVSQTGRVTIQ